MRDLKADMETCKNATPGPWMASIDHEVEDYRVCQDNGDGECICCLAMMGNWDQETQEWTGESKTSFAADTRFIAAAREGWPHAIERAITAEAEVERLTDLLDHYNAKCAICDCSDDVTVLQAENAKLRKVVDAARVDRGRCNECCHHGRHCNLYKVCEALEVLDKEGGE